MSHSPEGPPQEPEESTEARRARLAREIALEFLAEDIQDGRVDKTGLSDAAERAEWMKQAREIDDYNHWNYATGKKVE